MAIKSRRFAVAAIALVLSVVLAACSDGEATETTQTIPPADELPELEFGRGELPITVPANWPMPEQHAIAGTMINGAETLTEVVYTAQGNLDEILEFYESELPAADYEFTTSTTEHSRYYVDFSGNGIEGQLVLAPASGTITGATLQFVYSS